MFVSSGDWNLQDLKENDGLENDGLKNDGVEQEQTYILHPMKNFNMYDM